MRGYVGRRSGLSAPLLVSVRLAPKWSAFLTTRSHTHPLPRSPQVVRLLDNPVSAETDGALRARFHACFREAQVACEEWDRKCRAALSRGDAIVSRGVEDAFERAARLVDEFEVDFGRGEAGGRV